MERFDHLVTEKLNNKIPDLESITTLEYIEIANEQHKEIFSSIDEEKEKIVSLIDAAYKSYRSGGNIVYVGAGISGTIAKLDCDSCSSFFGTEQSRFSTIVAGDMKNSDKNPYEIEESKTHGRKDAKEAQISNKDFVIAVSASGRTPYVLGVIDYANQINAKTACVCCNKQTALGGIVEYPVEIKSGSELILGFTKMKSASVEKSILNIISTGIIVKSGRTYKNLTPFLVPITEKQHNRAITIIMEICKIGYDVARRYYELSKNNCLAAIIMLKYDVSLTQAEKYIDPNNSADDIINNYP